MISFIVTGGGLLWLSAMAVLALAFRPKRHWKTMPRRYPPRIEPPRTVQGVAIPKRKAIER